MAKSSITIPEPSRAGISVYKISQFLANIFTGASRKAQAYLDSFQDIDIEILQYLTNKKIKALILDLDGTLAPPDSAILAPNLAKLDQLQAAGITLVVYSNATANVSPERKASLAERKIPLYSGQIAKPDPRGFLAVCQEFNLNPETTWMVGDDPNTDGGALNMQNGKSVLGGMIFVEPIKEIPGKIRGLKKAFIAIKNLLRSLILWLTKLNNPQLIKSNQIKAERSKWNHNKTN